MSSSPSPLSNSALKDLAIRLELDLMLGRRQDFRKRLRQALVAVHLQNSAKGLKRGLKHSTGASHERTRPK